MKTKIGISAGILAAAAYFLGLVGGWVPVLLIAGYVLIAEENQWLRMSVVKAATVCVFFSVLIAFVNFLPDAITLINSLAGIFGGTVSIYALSSLVTFVVTALTVVQKVLLLIMGFAALNMKTVNFKYVDNLIEKHILKDTQEKA